MELFLLITIFKKRRRNVYLRCRIMESSASSNFLFLEGEDFVDWSFSVGSLGEFLIERTTKNCINYFYCSVENIEDVRQQRVNVKYEWINFFYLKLFQFDVKNTLFGKNRLMRLKITLKRSRGKLTLTQRTPRSFRLSESIRLRSLENFL